MIYGVDPERLTGANQETAAYLTSVACEIRVILGSVNVEAGEAEAVRAIVFSSLLNAYDRARALIEDNTK